MLRVIVAALAVAVLPASAQAQSWPQKPVTMVVSQAAGNSPDVLCRIITDRLAKSLGQAFVVENRAGAANLVGTQAVARAAPDGYTFLFATAAALVTNPYMFKTLPYDPVKDFVPVANIARSNFVLLVHPDVKATTLPELIALEKKTPGQMSLAVDGPRNVSGIIAQYINKLSGTQFVLVPYNTISNAIQDSITGRTAVTIQSASVAEPFIKDKKLTAIAVAGSERLSWLPDTPRIADTLPGIELQGWFMIVAPAGTPADIVAKLNAEVARALADPEVKQRAASLGFEIDNAGPGGPDKAGAFLTSELALWGKVTKELGIEPQ